MGSKDLNSGCQTLIVSTLPTRHLPRLPSAVFMRVLVDSEVGVLHSLFFSIGFTVLPFAFCSFVCLGMIFFIVSVKDPISFFLCRCPGASSGPQVFPCLVLFVFCSCIMESLSLSASFSPHSNRDPKYLSSI